MNNTVIIDLDGTLCNSAHREHHSRNGDWDAFHAGLWEDEAHEDVLMVVRALEFMNVDVVACTGRPEQHRVMTERWLIEKCVPIEQVLMRPEFDFRQDATVKMEQVELWHEDTRRDYAGTVQERVAFILEDRDRMVEAWRSAGFNCWQVRQGTF